MYSNVYIYFMERKTLQIDLNTHTWLVDYCKEKNYNIGGWAAKAIRDSIYREKYGKEPVSPKESISSKLKTGKRNGN
jgi:hypothetical protein